MARSTSFGEWLKAQRGRKRLTLRVFAKKAGLDPGNLSRYERGIVQPPQDEAVLERIGHALALKPRSKPWNEMVHLSAIGGGRIPPDVARDPELLKALPILFRTLKGKKLTEDELIRLARRIQES
jgi:transcriptional regulator with XRE-family HTH domain